MKTIHRRKFKRDYTPLPNDLLRDKTLKLRSRAILCMMLSHSEEWRSSMKSIEEHVSEGRDAIRTAVRELESAGYAVRKTLLNQDNTFAGTLWTWHDTPVPIGERSKPPNDRKPTTGNPSDGKPATGKGSSLRKNNSEQSMDKTTPKHRKLVTTGTDTRGGLRIGFIPSSSPHEEAS